MKRTLAVWAVLCAAVAPLAAQSYAVTHTYALGGDGGWDYLALDTAGHRLFIARGNRIMVVDPEKGTLLAEIPGFNRAHGVAFAYAAGRGFATSGGDSSVVMFDLKALQVLGRIPAADDADAILFDPATGHIFTFNGDANSSTVIDPASGQRIGTIPLGGKPEFGVATGDGTLFANIEDSSQIVQIDAAAMTVTRRWSLGACQEPSGLALDRTHHRLFSVCRNSLMAISDATGGAVVTTVPIGAGVDASRFDPATQLAFASNGEGSLTVIREDAPDKFTAVATIPTKRGARTMELDLKTHRVYTASADFGPAPAPTAERPRPRPPMVPGTFALLVLEPQAAYRREVPAALVALAKITEDSARAVALTQVPGGTVRALELEREHGVLIYSWDIAVAGKPGITEVHVSAIDGKVLAIEHESH